MSSAFQDQASFPKRRRKNTKTPLNDKGKTMRDLYKALGFKTVAGSELKKKMDVFTKDLKLPVAKITSNRHPEARKLADRFCQNDENTIALWPRDVDGNTRRLEWPNDKAKWAPLPKNNPNLDPEPGPVSDAELSIPQRHQNLSPRVRQSEDVYNFSRPGASLIPATESSAIGQDRGIIDRSNPPNNIRDDIHREDCIAHIRQIKPKDDEKMMADFISQQWLNEAGASWMGQGSLEPDHYIFRFMHEFMYYNEFQELRMTKFLGLFHEVPSIEVLGHHYNTLKGRLSNRMRKLVASLVEKRLLIRNPRSGRVFRTKELEEAWEGRHHFWSQPYEAVDETEPHPTRRREVYEMSSGSSTTMPEVYSDNEILTEARDFPRKRPLYPTPVSNDVTELQFSAEKRQKLSTPDNPPATQDKGKEVDRGQNSSGVPQPTTDTSQSGSTCQFGRSVPVLEEVLDTERGAVFTVAPTIQNTTTDSPTNEHSFKDDSQMSNSQWTLTPPVSPMVRTTTIKLEPNPPLGTSSRLSLQKSADSRTESSTYLPNAHDPKPTLFPTPSPQPETQASMDSPSSDDELPLVTLSNNINFVLLAKQKFDFEHPLIFKTTELEDLSPSFFISAFAARTSVKAQKIDGLKFTILLCDARSEKVMRGDARRWEMLVEIIEDLWKYCQVQWATNPRLKSKVCRILTERIETRALL
ncbi:hypothetical protein NHQ30_011075 [Ciborinia camelliae]|nr:hypothetical protein NHQ30_011075 [Ciborinia camelliae]